MGISIDESGLINNESGPKYNPRELEYYSHYIKRTYSNGAVETGWTISGDVPLGISIDGSGNITGIIRAMWEQPSCNPKKDKIYMEIDGRNSDLNGRYEPQTYDFVFTTTVNWVDNFTSGSTSEIHTITLVKDHDADTLKFAKEYLDIWENNGIIREPYHCILPSPSSEHYCNLIGGTWNEKHLRCSIEVPDNETTCENLGGTWETINGKSICNISIIQNREQCELIGGIWTKNTLMVNKFDESGNIISSIECDNFDDYIDNVFGLNSIYDGKKDRLQGVNE